MENETEATTPSITLPDISNAVRIIDAAAERGAFRGNELSQVGAVRDRLAAFLAAVAPEPEGEANASSDEEAEPEANVTEAPTPKKKKSK